uniref:E3 ubiquitin-protein ligase Topors n=1 Tax=Salvator merianae TaxID=96440 RepID=A0A8D0KMN2_SALMN
MYRDPRELRGRAGGANGRRRHRSKPNITSVMDNFRAGPDKQQQTTTGGASPDSKCPICLDSFENVAFLDHCWHKFCFCCIQEWSKNKAECPLCKQPFYSIVHTMRSENDFKVYTVKPSDTAYSANPERRRFRYRTTMTRERRTSVYQRSSTTRRTVSPPDNGVLFEGLSTQTTRQRNADMHHMIRRLASRRQAILEGRTTRQIQEQEMINFRRALYRSGIRVRSVEDGGRYRDTSAEFFRRNPACLHRLVPWLKRELTVLFGSHGSLVNIVQHVIMSNVTRYDMDSQAFSDDLKPFLLHSTVHFLHEFITFARSPFNMEAYDQHANYDCPAPSYEEGSHSDSSIIIISPEGAGDQGTVLPVLTGGLEQAEWDDETPGPSYSSSDQVQTTMSTTLDTSDSSNGESSTNAAELQTETPAIVEMNGDSCDSSDSCVIIGYVKPLAERTPELVELSSDSEESLDGVQPEEVPEVQSIQYHSFSDTDARGYASPFSDQSRDGSVYRSKRSEKEKSQTKDYTSRTGLEKSSAKRNYNDDDDDGYTLSKRRRYGSYARRSRSRERHGLKSKRKHRSMEKRKRKRDSSRHKHRKEKKKSRTRDRSLSRKSQTHSLSSESTELRDLSRSSSHSKEKSKRKAKSKDSEYDSVRNDSYHWDCAPYHRKTAQDDYESPYRRRTAGRNQYSRQSGSPDYLVDLPNRLSEYTNSQNPRSHTENGYYNYERHRSRSRSSSRSRTPPRRMDRTRSEKTSGKRKSKTNHLEETHGGSKATSTKEKTLPEKALPKYQDIYKKIGTLLGKHAENQHRKRKKMSRSPSVEIIYEGKPTDTGRQEKKRKTEDKPKCHASCSSLSSPVVITIDSDSDKTEWESSISSSPPRPLSERETELPPFLENRDNTYDKANETESMDKDSNIMTTKKDVVDETSPGDLHVQGTASRHIPTLTDNCTLFDAEDQSSSVETESLTQYPIVTSPLLLRFSRKLLEHSCQLDSEQKV